MIHTYPDVVEFFLGADWDVMQKYREFEIAPTGDWIDLAIDLRPKSYDRDWRSGFKMTARIDEAAHIWYAAARVPLMSVTDEPVKVGTRWRATCTASKAKVRTRSVTSCACSRPVPATAIRTTCPKISEP